MNSFIENVNYVANLDNKYGSGIELYKNNLSLKSVQHDIELKFSYYNNDDKKIHSIVYLEPGVLVGGIDDTLLSFKTLVESSITGSEFTCTVSSGVQNFVINNIVMVNIAIDSNNNTYKVYELEMKVITAGAATYDVFGEVKDSLKILPSLAMITASDIDAIANVYEIQEDVITVSENIVNIETVSDSIANVNTVAISISNVNIVGEDIANVNTVSAHISNVDTVSQSITNVNTVSSNIVDVGIASTNIASINTVANAQNLVDIIRVADDLNSLDVNGIADITIVANDLVLGVDSNIMTVSESISNVNTTGNNIDNVNTVGTNIIDVGTVSTNIANVNIAATNIVSVNNVSSSIADVNTVSDGIANVNIVSSSIANVDTVATNITGLNSIVSNIVEILSADENAAIATAKALEASNSAAASLQSSIDAEASASAATNHIADKNNPHEVTKSQVGLEFADNTADIDKVVASAGKLNTARNITLGGDVTGTVSFDGSADVTVVAAIAANSVALGADTTGNYVAGVTAGTGITVGGTAGEGWTPSVAITNVGTAGTYTKVTTNAQGQVTNGATLSAGDIPSLDASKITSGVIDAARLPAYVDDVLEFANLVGFPVVGETGKIYVALDTNKAYRWSGSAYIYITSGAVDSVAGKTGVVTLVKADVGLSNVDNTSDVNKPISTATSTALNSKQGTLVSGTNIKTVNSESVLGSGNIVIPVTTINNTLTSTSTTEALSANMGKTLQDTKQNTLVSNTNIKTINGNSVLGSGNISTIQTSVSGNAGTATTLSTTRINYKSVTDSGVVGELMWKHYGNGHTIFDASNSTTPTGVATNNTNPDIAWSATLPTLMGYNETNTYGVRVDSSRYADQLKTAKTITLGGDLTGSVNFDGSDNVTLSAQVNDNSHNHTDLSAGTVRFDGSTGNGYNNSNIEVRGNGPANTIKPGIGFHQPGMYAGTLSMLDGNAFQFSNQSGQPATLINHITGSAGTATIANTINNSGNSLTFNWSGQGGQPTWLYGGDYPSNAYVYNPSNFSVNYANSAGYATTAAVGTNNTQIATTAFVLENVNTEIEKRPIGSIGSYAFLSKMTSGGSIAAGETLSGTNLKYTGIAITSTAAFYSTSGGQDVKVLTGTWKALGACLSFSANWYPSTLWIRIT